LQYNTGLGYYGSERGQDVNDRKVIPVPISDRRMVPVLTLVAAGKEANEIATELSISPSSVYNILDATYRRYGIPRNRRFNRKTIALRRALSEGVITAPPARTSPYYLSPAYRRVISLVAIGLTSEVISSRLGKTKGGIDKMVSDICECCGVNNRAALVVFAVANGLA
jgi:DNA-binding NarL/FixJ family response regulator